MLQVSRDPKNHSIEHSEGLRNPPSPRLPRLVWWFLIASLIVLTFFLHPQRLSTEVLTSVPWNSYSHIESCTKRKLKTDTNNLSFLSSAHPIKAAEFVARQEKLTELLDDTRDAEAFVFEPGYFSSLYYANFSQRDWEPWEPEERPFLGVVMRVLAQESARFETQMIFLVPKFEEERARRIEIPTENGMKMQMVTYEEHWDPYATLRSQDFWQSNQSRIMVDDEMREFVVRGLRNAGFKVVGISKEVEEGRQIKSDAETGILEAVNTGTVEAIRAMQKCK